MKNTLKMALWAFAVLAMVACSGDDEPSVRDVRARQLTVRQRGAASARVTRATLTEVDKALAPSWVAGDEVTCAVLSGDLIYGPLTALSTAATSMFTGTVECAKGDYLAMVYPAVDEVDLTPSYTPFYTISLAGQDGTLGTLARNYHYVYGVARVTSVTESTADADLGEMKSLLTVCRFSFTDKETGNDLCVKTLSIGYNDMEYNSKYPQSATVEMRTNQGSVTATPQSAKDTNAPLEVVLPNATKDVYVALLPIGAEGTPKSFFFTVVDENGQTYSGKKKAVLIEGDFAVAEGMTLTKQTIIN